MINKIKKSAANLVARASYKTSEKNANSTCVFLHGQSQIPSSVKKLLKRSK